MVKRLGSLVGVPAAATPPQFHDNFCKDGVDATFMRDKIALAVGGGAVGDTVSLGSFRSTSRISPTSKIWNDAFGAGVTLAIGDATYPAGFAAAFSVAAAGAGDLWKSFTPAQMALPLWQTLGYPADPGGFIELLATIGGAAIANAGGLAWQVHGHT